jgi:hypothetical protein
MEKELRKMSGNGNETLTAGISASLSDLEVEN